MRSAILAHSDMRGIHINQVITHFEYVCCVIADMKDKTRNL